MQVVPVPRFPVGKRTLPPRRHTGAGGLARYAPLPPLCTRCCDGLLLLATKGTPSLLRNLEHRHSDSLLVDQHTGRDKEQANH